MAGFTALVISERRLRRAQRCGQAAKSSRANSSTPAGLSPRLIPGFQQSLREPLSNTPYTYG
jgi:hypothetical protein